MQIVWALLSGSFIGLVLGFVGAGGAMLSVPILIYGFNYAPKNATVAALAIVFSAAIAGAIPKFRTKSILIRDAIIIWAIGFSVILIIAGTSMLLGPIVNKAEKDRPLLLLIFISLLIGAMAGIFGVGGGFLAIPVLVRFFHISLEKASGTSLLIIALNCATAFLSHYSRWGLIKWEIPLIMLVSAVVIASLASSRSSRVPTQILRRSFALLLYAIAVYSVIRTTIG